ncbi:hypothetical protein HYV86_07820 [Candidatus Woesearchaeota archaeon]|nr:hypothetical protein [Candidatus Woesearchaeota archaeon]
MVKPIGKHRRVHKKALTPIIATFLLVSFAVAVGVVVMNLGSAQVEEEAECPVEVGLALAMVKGKEHVCYDTKTKTIQFTVKNGKNSKVEGLIVNIIGEDGSQSEDLVKAKMPKAGTYRGKIVYNLKENGAVEQIEIVPKITPFDEEQICTEQALLVEEVKNC